MTIDAMDTRWAVHPFELPMLLGNADSAGAGAFVVGEVPDGWQTLDLAALPVSLYLDGEPAGDPPWEGEKRGSLSERYAAPKLGGKRAFAARAGLSGRPDHLHGQPARTGGRGARGRCCFSESVVGSPRQLVAVFRSRIYWKDGAIR